jgi:excisionase family DNA binding protein
MDRFLETTHSVPEIADYLQTSRVYIERQILAGNLRARKLSYKVVRILPEDLRDWLERCAVQPKNTDSRVAAVQEANA